MRRLAMQAAVLVTALISVESSAGSIFRYHDPKTNRDVFVTERDQIPAAHRDQAQQVVVDGVWVDPAQKADANRPVGTVIFGDRKPAGWWEAIGQVVSQALRSPSRIDWRRGLTTAVDTDLVRRGLRPLSAVETQRGLSLVVRTGWWLLIVGSLALVGWILMMVQAWMANQRGWVLGILLCQPLSLLYALKFAEGKPRWWRALMALLQVAPHVVLVMGTCWLHAWFAAILGARGL
jgi:hypothetical protein